MELGVSCALVTGSVKSKIGGQADVVVGTHALIQKGFEFRDLAVAVVDEQHRFGVEQRSALDRGPDAARAPHDRDADPAHARAHGVRRPRRERDREATREPEADRHRLGHRRAKLRGLHPPARPPHGRPPGVRRLPADRGVEGVDRARGRAGGGSAARRRAEGLPRRLHARAAEAGRAARPDGPLQGTGARRARGDDGDRGRCRRPERDDHDRAGGGSLRARPAAPAARPGRARGGAVVLPAGLRPEGGADGERARPARGDGRLDGRVRARREGSRDPRRRRAARRAPVRALRSPLRPDHARPRAARAGAGRRARRCRRRRWRRRSTRSSARPSTSESPEERQS